MKNISKRTSGKILSFLLLVSMLAAMFPAAGFAESSAAGSVSAAVYDEAITVFEPITIDAGTAGSAAYEDARAVLDYLNGRYDRLSANGGAVTVPVAGWEETDAYDPATAGSYTFTATLGEIPAGYVNSNNLTATAQVVVAEAAGTSRGGTGEEAEEEPAAGQAPDIAIKAVEVADGAYTLPVSLWHAANDQPSMGNNALEQTGRLVVADGQGTLQLTFKPLTFMGMTGYLSQLDLLDNIVFNENNYPVSYDLIPATVISTHDVVDDFNKPDSTDPNCAGKPYPRDLSIPVVLGQEYTWVHVYVPVMGSLGFGDQVARIKLDWSNLVQVPEEENPVYTLTPAADEAYQAGTTPDGILTMTVNEGFSGLKYFGVQVTPVREHGGKEAVVFTHQRDGGVQLSLNVTKADFDAVPEAQAGFNVLAGDEIAVYIVDDLTNDPDTNPIILQ